jgi:hypothetical protein
MKSQLIAAFFFGALILASAGIWAVVQNSQAHPETVNLLAIPLKPDPPPAMDGELREWASVPNSIKINRKEQCVYGGDKWKSPNDLSATMWLAWRGEYLFVAADVTDDKFRQTERGMELWKGDHIELYLDATPDAEPQRRHFGKGQFQMGFSPGNFQRTGDPLFDLKPEAVIYKPEGRASQGVLVAAKRTEKGYAMEVALPWSLVGVKPSVGVSLGVEVGVSDCDADETRQEKMMTILTATWGHTRDRLAPAVLSPADGKTPPVVRGFDVFPSVEVKARTKYELTFNAPKTPPGREAVLSLKARLHYEKPAGYNPCMRLILNGKPLDATRLLNKKPTMTMADGRTQNAAAGDHFTVAYAPDFDSPDTHPNYALRGAKVCAYDLRVTDLLKEGANTLVIENNIGRELMNALVVGDGRLEFRAPVELPQKKGAPTGRLPTFAPASHKVNYAIHEQSGDLLVAFGGETFRAQSEFSTPEPKWQKGSNRYFTFKRQIEQRDEAVVVRDTFTNWTDENLPIMQRHRVPMKLKKVWLAGLSPSSLTGTTSAPENPTTFGVTDKAGIGLLPLDDVFQVHTTNFSDGKSIGLADNNFVLKPKATHTAEWAIVLVQPVTLSAAKGLNGEILRSAQNDNASYFAFINAARRLRGVNFTMDGSFAFLRADPNLTGKWTDEQLTTFVRNKSAKWLCSSIDYPRYNGHYPHGTAFQTIDHAYRKDHIARLRRLTPEAQHLVYFHCFIDVLDDADKKYADARVLKSDGSQANYGEAQDRIFFPTHSNSFGRDIGKNVDIILNEIGSDGIYWDELEYSAYQYHYGEPWDGVSADVDPKTMKITRLKSSVTLITQAWRVALAKRIMASHPLIGNGAPHTRTMASLHFPRFVETGSISNCARAQLFTPIALGDHLTERSELDAYHVMLRALDYGCVYYWYDDVHVGIPTHPHLTQFMFPITPVELGEGFIIGLERIITNRSGVFGWNDDAQHEVHVFDDEGREVKNFRAATVRERGKMFTELRIAEGWSAAIVRKGQ